MTIFSSKKSKFTFERRKIEEWNDDEIVTGQKIGSSFGHFRVERILHENLKALTQISLRCLGT